MPQKKPPAVPQQSPDRFVLPKGFKPHHGGDCPVEPGQYVEAIVITAEGFGSAGVTRADRHLWPHAAHDAEGGLGAVHGYRLAVRGERPRFGSHERF